MAPGREQPPNRFGIKRKRFLQNGHPLLGAMRIHTLAHAHLEAVVADANVRVRRRAEIRGLVTHGDVVNQAEDSCLSPGWRIEDSEFPAPRSEWLRHARRFSKTGAET